MQLEDLLTELEGFSLSIVDRCEFHRRARSANFAISLYHLLVHEMKNFVMLELLIAIAHQKLAEIFNNMRDGECLRNYLFQTCDIWHMVKLVGLPSNETNKDRNSYSNHSIMSKCVV